MLAMRTMMTFCMLAGVGLAVLPTPTFAQCGITAWGCPAGLCQRCMRYPSGECFCAGRCYHTPGCGGYSGPPTPNYGQAEKPKGKYWKFRHETNPRY